MAADTSPGTRQIFLAHFTIVRRTSTIHYLDDGDKEFWYYVDAKGVVWLVFLNLRRQISAGYSCRPMR